MATKGKSRTTSGITPYTGTWDNAAVIHLLRRVHFGVKKQDLDYFKGKTMDQSVDEILTIDYSVPSPPINNYNDRNADPNIAPGATWVNDYNGSLNNSRRASFKQWWVGQSINHDRTVREKMVLFWHNHFATESRSYNWANFAYQSNLLFRNNCLKNFKSLVKDVALDPAMLIYLNGERNTKTAPDENFARELQELFTLGKGPDSQYTEDDVINGAKVLTGWRINKSNGDVFFQPNRHDETNKTFSSFYGGNTINGRSGPDGENELDDFLAMIFLQNEVAKHMVRKFYRWFVYYDIDSDTETNVITPLASIFRNSGYEILPVLKALFKSEHFFDLANRDALIKSPADFTLGLCRSFDLQFADSSNYLEQYKGWSIVHSGMAQQQQDFGDPPSVAGWSAYYQLPQYHELWINSDTLPKRNIISDVLISFGYRIGTDRLKIDTLSFTSSFDNPGDPNILINDFLELLHTLDVAQAQKDYMKSILLSGQINDNYWTYAWDDYINDPNDMTKQTVVANRLTFLIKYLMNLSEYQLS